MVRYEAPHSNTKILLEESIARTALRETITTLEKTLQTSLIPLGSTLMSLWHAIDSGTLSRHKAILLVGFTIEEEKNISEALKNLLTIWHEHAQEHNLAIGLATHTKGKLTTITPQDEALIHTQKEQINTLAKYSEVGALIGIIVLANIFNDARIFNPKDSLGKEYGDDNYILKHITFTQFDLLILALLPTFALLAKQWYLQTWRSPIVHSTRETIYAEVRDANPKLLTGSDHMTGAFHRAHGGILWIGPETIKDRTCRNLLRTGLTLGHYETPQGIVPNAFLTIVSTTSLADLHGTENDGRFTVISKKKEPLPPFTKTPLISSKKTRTQPTQIRTVSSDYMKQRHLDKNKFIDEFQVPYSTFMESPSSEQWTRIYQMIKTIENPLILITGLDTVMDTVFENLEARDPKKPYALLLSGPYGAAKTTIGKEVAKILAPRIPKPENTYYALETQGGRLALTQNTAPYIASTQHLMLRKITYGMGSGMALLFTIVNIAVTTNYYKNDVSFQDGLDRLQFAWMLLVAWVGLLSMVAKAGYDLSQKNDNPQTLITDFSTPNVIGNANEDLTTHDLAGKEIATTGFPHNRFTFESALLLQNVGLFAENWDAIAADPKRKILESMASGNLQIPTGETIPTRSQFLIATTNHPETDELQNFVHHAFSLVVPWRHQDDMLIVANIIRNSEPHAPYWSTEALTTFLDFCRNKDTALSVLTRQVLVDMVREIGNLAYYFNKDNVDPATVIQVWQDRVFEGPLTEIREAYHQVHGL